MPKKRLKGKRKSSPRTPKKVTCGRKGKSKCSWDVQYRCDKSGKYYCYDHSHLKNSGSYCCHYEWRIKNGYLVPEEVYEEAEDNDPSKIPCARKSCKGVEAEYWCEREKEWLCIEHYHLVANCCRRSYGYGVGFEERDGGHEEYHGFEEEKEKRKPLKEVKFINV